MNSMSCDSCDSFRVRNYKKKGRFGTIPKINLICVRNTIEN